MSQWVSESLTSIANDRTRVRWKEILRTLWASKWLFALLYFSVLWMLKYSIGWRPSIWGGRLFRPLLRLFLTFLSQFFCKMSNFYMSPSQRKKLGFENSFYPSEIGLYFLGFFLCTNWGCFAWIEVVLHRLRLFCTDWGCPAQIEVAPHRLRLPCTDRGCHEQSEGRHHTFHLKSSPYICGRIRNIISFQHNLYKCSSLTLDLPWNLSPKYQ